MAEEKRFEYLRFVMPLIAVAALLVGGFFVYQTSLHEESQNQVACTMEAMQCPDGSYVGRTGPNCEFAACPTGQTYTNNQYGFSLQLPDSWAGYSVIEGQWQGRQIDNNAPFQGPQITLRNPKWTASQVWQDIPVMVFTKQQWDMVIAEKLAVSAAPIPPSKLGENQNYVFALPPRWVGFTDAEGQQEAQQITQTFKAF